MTTDEQRTPPKTDEGTESLAGVVERVIFHNAENGYTVARLIPDGSEEGVVVVGTLPVASPGEALALTGKWTTNPMHGRQFSFTEHTPVLPTSVLGIEKYLGSGLVKGIGPVLAKRMVAAFGAETLDVLDSDPAQLKKVSGIGPKRRNEIREAWAKQTAIRETMIFLQDIGISVSHAARLVKLFGRDTARLIQQDPYRALLDIRGIGFKTVDKVASKLSIAHDAHVRLRAGVEYTLGKFVDDGHVFVPTEELFQEAEHILDVEREPLEQALGSLITEQRVVMEGGEGKLRIVYPTRLHRAEQSVAFRLAQLISTRHPLISGDPEERLKTFERDFKFQFAEQQRTALTTAMRGGVMVITGGPGTGKTTLLRALLRMLEGGETRTLLCSPTGRAAKRMSQAARQPAQTIHRLLQWSPAEHRFVRNANNPLPTDLVVVDEVSMLDIALAADLLDAIEAGCSLLLIGDVDQLPAVGPGNVLRDVIKSEAVPVIRLNEIFRHAGRSLIVQGAHQINRGEMPFIPKSEQQAKGADLFFIEKSDPEEALETIKALVHERIPSRFGFDAVRDVQVITPMRRGTLGMININVELQALLNRDSRPLMRGGRTWKRGDKVMQISNNYDKDVYNGDMGFITEIDPEEQCLTVRFDARQVDYGFDELDELELAYAITIHKSQGSEFPATVIPIHSQHHIMLQRNLLYTAITRGRKLVTIVGTKRALGKAVHEASRSHRHTGLAKRLRDLLA